MRKPLLALLMSTVVLVSGCAGQAAAPQTYGSDGLYTGESTEGGFAYDTFEPFREDSAGRTAADGSMGPSGPAGPMGPPGASVASGSRAPMPAATPVASPPPKGQESATSGSSGSLGFLQVTERKVISNGSISLEVEGIQPAIGQVRTVAESLGGHIEQLSSSGHVTRGYASLTIRVPQSQFFTALERVQALGKVTGQNIGSEDVSEQYIDLEARLKSAQRQEESYLALLQKTATVSDVLTIERELARVRGEIEKFQGQLSFLDRRVELATINISLNPPAIAQVTPPAGALTVSVKDVSLTASEVKGMVATMEGVIESSNLTIKDGHQRAVITFRVFSADFDKAMSTLEGKGKVESKDIREGGTPDASAPKPEKPDARIQVNVVEPAPREIAWERIILGSGIAVGILGVSVGLFALTRGLRRRPATA